MAIRDHQPREAGTSPLSGSGVGTGAMIHRTRPQDAAVHCSGWARLPSGVEVTRLPLVDMSQQLGSDEHLFARLTYADALAVAEREGARLIAPETLLELYEHGLVLVPYLGTPTAETALGHSRRHDVDVWRQLGELGWDGRALVANAGKHWVSGAPAGRSRLMGWRKGDGTWWQPLAVAHNRQHHDDGTTTLLERDHDPGRVSIKGETELRSERDTRPEPTPPRMTSQGETGPDVVAWQRWLMAEGYSPGRWGADGKHGPVTEVATEAWLADRGLARGGSTIPELPRLPPDTEPAPPMSRTVDEIVNQTIPARNFTAANRPRSARRVIVLHSMEGGTAESVARWFGGPSAPQASAHFCVGPHGIVVAGVPLEHVAWAAPGMNRYGIQIEQEGYAYKTDWLDGEGLATMRTTAELVAALCREEGIPAVRLEPHHLQAPDCTGITTHWSVTRAFGKSTHVDPGGPNDKRWPWVEFLRLVQQHG